MQAGKSLKKCVEDSLRTSSKNKHETLDLRKRRSIEFNLGDNVAGMVQTLSEEKPTIVMPVESMVHQSPLNAVFERYANFEKFIGHLVAENDMDIESFWTDSNTAIGHLLSNELPGVAVDKKRLEQLVKRKQQSEHNLEKEERKLDTMQNNAQQEDHEVDPEVLNQQIRKRDAMAREVEGLVRDVALEQDKLTSKLLTLSSRENRYARSVVDLMIIRTKYFQEACNIANAQLQEMERLLQETHHRPVFGEELEDHLKASGREIAAPISLAICQLRKSGLNDEGLFRLSAPQIKLNKLKALLDSNLPLTGLLVDADSHLYAGLLKCYLRELPTPLLGKNYHRWANASNIDRPRERVQEIRKILRQEVTAKVAKNIQYVFKFLLELSTKSQVTKMDVHNIAIVLGPNLLWQDASMDLSGEHGNVDRKIKLVTTLIENYDAIFDDDIQWTRDYEDLEGEIVKLREELKKTPPSSPEPSNNNAKRLSLMPGSPNTSETKASPSHRRRLETNILKMWGSKEQT